MKKILVVICLFFLAGCGTVKTYNEISYKEFKNMIDKKNDFVLFIGSSTCSACKEYKATLNEVIKDYNLDIKYIDLSKLSDKQSSEFSSNFPISGTPTTLFIEDGVENDTYNRIVGNVRYSKIVEKLKNNNYIKG